MRRARRWQSRRATVMAAAALVSSACGPAPEPAGDASGLPPVLLVTIDTLRADRVGAYGAPPDATPTLDSLAAAGVLFETVYAPMGTTCPSHATLFTARHPLGHGVVRNGLALAGAEVTLAERLQDAGYETAAFVSAYPLKRRFGLAQGFDHYDDDFAAATPSLQMRRWEGHAVEGVFDREGSLTVDRALDWLADRASPAPLFLWVHLFDPHWPYTPPAAHVLSPVHAAMPPEERERALYAGEVRHADAQLARLLAAFPEATAPLVLVTADHGEGLYDHGFRTHNRFLYEEEVRVPWILHAPGRLPAGRRVVQPAHLIDVAPTLLSLLGLSGLEAGDGIDLTAQIRGDAQSLPRALFLQRPHYPGGRPKWGQRGPGFGVRLGRYKLIEAPDEGRRELYDLVADPREQRDLSGDEMARAEQLAGRLAAWRDGRVAPDGIPELDPRDLEALRALGYVDD